MAITNYGDHVPGLMMLPIFLGTVDADVTKKVGFKMPWKCDLYGVRTFARASSGTTPTLTVDVLEGGVSMLSAPVAVVADTYTDATISDGQIADEANLTMDVAVSGTTPVFSDVTVLLIMRRTN